MFICCDTYRWQTCYIIVHHVTKVSTDDIIELDCELLITFTFCLNCLPDSSLMFAVREQCMNETMLYWIC